MGSCEALVLLPAVTARSVAGRSHTGRLVEQDELTAGAGRPAGDLTRFARWPRGGVESVGEFGDGTGDGFGCVGVQDSLDDAVEVVGEVVGVICEGREGVVELFELGADAGAGGASLEGDHGVAELIEGDDVGVHGQTVPL